VLQPFLRGSRRGQGCQHQKRDKLQIHDRLIRFFSSGAQGSSTEEFLSSNDAVVRDVLPIYTNPFGYNYFLIKRKRPAETGVVARGSIFVERWKFLRPRKLRNVESEFYMTTKRF
jgi:hypothetical protein